MWFIIILLLLLGIAWGAHKWAPSRGVGVLTSGICGVLAALWVFFSIVLVVPAGTVKVGTLFGSVQEKTYDQGMHVVNPFLGFTDMSVRRQIIEFQSGKTGSNSDDVVAVSNDNLPLTVEVTYAYRLNPTYASWLYRNIGNEETFTSQLVVQAARAATRSAAAQFNYDQATTTQRDLLARAMEADFRRRLIEDMTRQGLSAQQAPHVFNILPVQLRKVLPPEKVQNAIAEKIASEQDLQRQKILTAIAKQEAERRGQEGSGVRKLFEQLPAGFSADQIATIMNALANKERADAQLKAVQSGKVSVMVMDGNPSVNVK